METVVAAEVVEATAPEATAVPAALAVEEAVEEAAALRSEETADREVMESSRLSQYSK